MGYKDPKKRREYQRRWAAENKDKIKEYDRRWIEKNPAKRRTVARKSAAERAARLGGFAPPDPGGPTLDDLLIEQEGRCAICCRALANAHPALDHDHTTGKIRAALCGKCNRGLGCFDENVAALMTAASYVIQHKNA